MGGREGRIEERHLKKVKVENGAHFKASSFYENNIIVGILITAFLRKNNNTSFSFLNAAEYLSSPRK